jgi:tetratricopeptide (TPR) repeat protein
VSCSPGAGRRRFFAGIFSVLVFLSGCARQSPSARQERIAILRFENLSGDDSISWEGRAFSEVLSGELAAGDPQSIPSSRMHSLDRALGVRPVSAPGISTENTLAIAAGATRIGYGEYWMHKGRLEARVTIEDPRTLKAVKVVEASAPAGDVLGAAGALARQISSRTVAYGTSSPQALAMYIKAIEAGEGGALQQGLTQAIAADPGFVTPYLLLVQVKAQQHDRAGAQAVLDQALALKNLSDVDRARFELEAAGLSGDRAARQAALLKLARLQPGDAATWRNLADLAMTGRDYRQAMQAYQKCSQLAPDDIEALNGLGYAAAHAGDLPAAMAALRRYQAIRPKDANPLDSMGDINLMLGHLTDAENFYLQAQKMDRSFLNDIDLMKVACARLVGGDAEGAGRIAGQYFEARTAARDPLVDYRHAEWNWIAGRRAEARRGLEAFAQANQKTPLRDFASRAWAELSLWSLLTGEREAATASAQMALSLASPASVGNAIVARFIALPPAPSSEWAVRAERQFPTGESGIRDFSLAYALLLNGEFAAAQPILKQMWDNSVTSDEGLPVMLAWTYLETGKLAEAAGLLRENPVVSATGLGPYVPLYLPRLLYLRGQLAEKQGRKEDAAAEYKKFRDLGGPDALSK